MVCLITVVDDASWTSWSRALRLITLRKRWFILLEVPFHFSVTKKFHSFKISFLSFLSPCPANNIIPECIDYKFYLIKRSLGWNYKWAYWIIWTEGLYFISLLSLFLFSDQKPASFIIYMCKCVLIFAREVDNITRVHGYVNRPLDRTWAEKS